MKFSVRNLFLKPILSLGFFTLTLGTFLLSYPSPLLFESEESLTANLTPVFNRIRFVPGWKSDTWIMQQSHWGLKVPFLQWDRIAIVMDKTSRPYSATFYQLPPGELGGSKPTPVDYKAACFLCHPNGPRAIRPNFQSASSRLGLLERSRVLLWNLRIKMYGRVMVKSVKSNTPFRYPGPNANAPLRIPTCTKCHSETGLFARGTLTRQNFMSIQFMIERKYMPPLGIELTTEARQKILGFLAK